MKYRIKPSKIGWVIQEKKFFFWTTIPYSGMFGSNCNGWWDIHMALDKLSNMVWHRAFEMKNEVLFKRLVSNMLKNDIVYIPVTREN